MEIQSLQKEWQLLQVASDNYEKYALLIKLLAFVLFVWVYLHAAFSLFIAIILAAIWLQEGIWKTFQARNDERILAIEKALKAKENEFDAFQLHSEFSRNRPGVISLITAYITNALKPTVAFPYVFLIPLSFWV